jgi:hypothetical protein
MGSKELLKETERNFRFHLQYLEDDDVAAYESTTRDEIGSNSSVARCVICEWCGI